jgi:deoxyribodipyrimidine photo-lyase
MADNARATGRSRALYYPYVARRRGQDRGLLHALGEESATVVTDWFPGFFIPRMLTAAMRQVGTRLEAVDSNGLIPLSDHARAFPTARGYRAFVQRSLRHHLQEVPDDEPLEGLSGRMVGHEVLSRIQHRWPPLDLKTLRHPDGLIEKLPIDHSVQPVAMRGGSDSASLALKEFIEHRLRRYGTDRDHPDLDATSRLSPYLHFGHIGAHQVFAAVMTAERWTTRKLATTARGARESWWGVSTSGEAFLDQLVVWRELAFNGAQYIPRFGSYATLPEWARRTLEAHQPDPRRHVYSVLTLEQAATSDEVWNAAMRQLKREGWFHGYMRMLWGKKILEWTRTPARALAIMEELMNRYSLDGRDPVSYANYAWTLGMYDRPWPERPVFGTVRAMTSASTKRKLRLKRYLVTYGDTAPAR